MRSGKVVRVVDDVGMGLDFMSAVAVGGLRDVWRKPSQTTQSGLGLVLDAVSLACRRPGRPCDAILHVLLLETRTSPTNPTQTS